MTGKNEIMTKQAADIEEKSKRGFISAPTVDAIKPSEQEVALLENMWRWKERSAQSSVVLGEPLRY
jgi:hypothetical protein